MISRTQSKLEEKAAEIKNKSKVEVMTIAVDYSKFDKVERVRVTGLLKDLDIGVLVNNVGISYEFTRYFHEIDDQRVEQLISMNVESTTWMSRIVLPGMIDRKRGNRTINSFDGRTF